MRKVLIIAYYWPPAGGGGVQRWLKFVKYLPEFGWEPTVYVPYNPQYPLTDPSLVREVPAQVQVIKGHIWEARRIYRRLKKWRHGRKWSAASEMDTLFFRAPGEMSWFGRLSLFLRSQLFIPDSRSLWIRPSIRRLRKWLTSNPVDMIISTGPPHSCHMIGLGLARATGIPWIADFRDPWIDIDYFPQLLMTARTLRKHERMQHSVLASASKVITVSPSWAALFREYGAPDVEVITNGFDSEDVLAIAHRERPPGDILRIANLGTLEADRNPKALWYALDQLSVARPDLLAHVELHLAGKVDATIIPDSKAIQDLLRMHGYVPHREALRLMSEADVLLLILNQGNDANARGRIPGKLFEYLAFNKPILLIGNGESDAADMVREFTQNVVVSHDDFQGMYQALLDLIAKRDRIPAQVDCSGYDRRRLTGKLAGIMKEVIS